MAETLIWWDVAETLVTGIAGEPFAAGVKVETGYPGDQVKGELIWLGDMEGEQSIPVSKAGRTHRDDIFDLEVNVRVKGRSTLSTTGERLQQMMAAVEDYIAERSGLEAVDGVVSAEITSRRMGARNTPDGLVGFGQITVQVHSRLT
jgi:hypothetical protein